MDKKLIVAAFVKELEREFDNLAKAAIEAREAATNEESKPENEYDTRGLEASYLAGAQAKRANEIRDQILVLRNLQQRPYGPHDPIGPTAVVTLEMNAEETRIVYLVPAEGGKSVRVAENDILILSLDSPLGKEIRGQKVGHSFTMKIKNAENEYEITKVE